MIGCRALLFLAAAGFVLATPGLVQRAQACSYVPTLSMGYPASGATGVPTNAVPWLWGLVGSETVTITLTDFMGAEVPADVVRLEGYVLGDYFEVRPHAELEPNRFYDLIVDGPATTGGDGYFRFTTGEGPATGTPPAVGALEMQVVDNATMSSCGDNTFACVGSTYAGVVQATVTDASGAVEARLLASVDGALRYARTAAASDEPFCVELRARDLAGRLGEPSTICSADVATFEVSTTSAVTCEGARAIADERFVDERDVDEGDAGPDPAGGATDDGGGCSVTGSATSGLGWIVASLLLVALRRRGGARRLARTTDRP